MTIEESILMSADIGEDFEMRAAPGSELVSILNPKLSSERAFIKRSDSSSTAVPSTVGKAVAGSDVSTKFS